MVVTKQNKTKAGGRLLLAMRAGLYYLAIARRRFTWAAFIFGGVKCVGIVQRVRHLWQLDQEQAIHATVDVAEVGDKRFLSASIYKMRVLCAYSVNTSV